MTNRWASSWLVGSLSLIALGCASSLETQARMFRHFGQARRIQNAAVFGVLADAHEAARGVRADAPIPGVPSGSEHLLEAVYESARAIEAAGAPEELPALSAQLADRCGACHEANRTGPVFPVGTVAPAEDLAGHMNVHAWAAERMWEAVISRSDEAWMAGAEALAGTPIDPDEFVPSVDRRGTAFILSSRAHYLAESSVELQGWEERAGLLSRLSSTCYECHALAGAR